MELHHIAVVVDDINASLKKYSEYFGFIALGPVVYEKRQKVFLVFMKSSFVANVVCPAVELIQPDGESSPIYRFLKEKGGGLHHLCFQVDDIYKTIDDFRQKGALPVVAPVSGAGVEGRLIAFMYTREKWLIEFVQK